MTALGPKREHSEMTRTVFGLLLTLSLALPGIIVAGFLGGSVPESLVNAIVALACVSAVAEGVLAMWALRLISRDPRLAATDKSAWRKFVFFTGVIGASLYLVGYLRRDGGGAT